MADNRILFPRMQFIVTIALWLNRKLNLKADRDRVIRSALLHDYFLYDPDWFCSRKACAHSGSKPAVVFSGFRSGPHVQGSPGSLLFPVRVPGHGTVRLAAWRHDLA